MSEAQNTVKRKPGIVIFVAIWQFFSAAFFLMLAVVAALAIAFGAAWGIDDYVSQQMSQYATAPNFTYGLTFIFSLSMVVCLIFGVYFLAVGVGLLKGKKFAWYLQVAMSLFSLVGVPLGFVWNLFMLPINAILNIVILILFFQTRIRDYFGV